MQKKNSANQKPLLKSPGGASTASSRESAAARNCRATGGKCVGGEL